MVASFLDARRNIGIHRAVVDQTGAVILTENQLSTVLKILFR